ncbi:MAG: DUF2520 domain-containing protein [Evtepia sp.]|uniref:Rossmann-like and DUF2520 domain-containing protein n=1 Tax=Evtepia sp. TaxID=2773933 RepID=UPI002A75D147|nr:DUF2520 domain-containing protein [Evtepia sp.]MDY3015278.1 DUF2520 domain-containing protein [Evtepia sp.]
MRIGFIGAGKVGFSLGKFFAQGGIPVTGYYSRHRGSAQEAAHFTGTKPYTALEALVRDSDALLFTVPDGAISSVFAQVREMGLAGKQICHCSGAMTAWEAFPGGETFGAYYYSIHPLFPISDRYIAYRELPGAFFCLEGEGPHLPWWETTLTGLGAQVKRIPSEGKVGYHAACAIASNLVCALAAESLALLEACGFSQEQGLAALAPLMQANLTHLLKKGPVEALTGAVERGDRETVAKHLACLPDENARTLYRTASLRLVSLAQKKHPEQSYQSMYDILKEGLNP